MQVINGWLQSPENSDAAFWTYIIYDINKLAFHVHDGTDGDKLPPSSLTQLASTATPSTPLGNLYYADVAFPVDNTWSNTTVSFFLNDERIYLDYEKIDEDNYRVWSALNGITYEVRYA